VCVINICLEFRVGNSGLTPSCDQSVPNLGFRV